MGDELEIISRPEVRRGRHLSERVKAIIGTAETGMAVRIPLNGVAVDTVEKSIRSSVRQQGFRLHIIRDKDALTAWAEPLGG